MNPFNKIYQVLVVSTMAEPRDIVVDQLDEQLRDLLGNLAFLSSLKIGEKVDTSTLTFVQKGWYTSITRTIKSFVGRGEGRDVTLEFVKEVTDNAVKYITSLLQKPEKFNIHVGLLILEELKKSRSCFCVLSETYNDDRHFKSQIVALELLLNAKILQIESTLLPKRHE